MRGLKTCDSVTTLAPFPCGP